MSTSVFYWDSVEISRQTVTVFELLTLSSFDKMDRKRKSAVGGDTHRKWYHFSTGRPKMLFLSPCFASLTATVCEFLSVLWFSRFQPEVVSGIRGYGKPEVASTFDFSTPLLY
jgi:hypothetical protein